MRRSNARRISTLIPARTRIQLFAMIRDGEPKRAHHSFAPLAGLVNKSGEDEYMKLQGIVFDMDGTLCEFVLLPHVAAWLIVMHRRRAAELHVR